MASRLPSRRSGYRALRGAKKLARRYYPSLESFEPRFLLSGDTYIVNVLTDTGAGTGFTGDLRYAITQADDDPGSTIDISASGTDSLVGSLPDLSADVTITESDPGTFVISGGGSESDYNAFFVENGVTATISGVDFTNFVSTGTFGGVLQVGGLLTLNNSTLEASSSPNGGAVFIGNEGSLTANQCTFQNDLSTGAGGAITNQGTLNLIGGSVLNNTASGTGGGVYNVGLMNANGVEIAGNTSLSDDGGAIYSDVGMGSSMLTLTNSTVAGNNAQGDGAGVYAVSNATLTNDTIANNSSLTGPNGGGVFVDSSSDLILQNTLIDQNFFLDSDVDVAGNGTIDSSSSYNFIGYSAVTGISDGSQGNQMGTSELPLDADLGSLTNNGGGNATIALNAGSPAIGAGLVANAVDPTTSDALLYDQRGVGFPRVVNGSIDIGAFQTQLPATSLLAVSTGSSVYGGTTSLLAQLTSDGTDVAGELVDFHLGATDLGTATTNSNGVAEIDNVSLASIHAGTYVGDVTASFAGDSSYVSSSGSADLTVTPASLTITANDQTKVYGAAVPTLTASYTGFVNGDTSASLDTAPTLDTTADATSHVAGSPYAITASGAVDTDYSISYVPGNLTVTAAPLTITANDQTKVYGAALPTLTASYTGFVNGDTSANLDTLPTLSTTADATSHVAGSPYAITASGAVDSDYTISYVLGNLTITAAPLTITANDQTKVYGAALPTLTASYTGFVNGDTSASLDTLPTLSTTADATSHVAGSPYAITASGAVDTDYSISYVPGNLTVTAAPLTITADNQTKVYGAALPTLTASYTGFVNGDTSANLDTAPTLDTTADATSHVAGSPYAITASGAVDEDYSISYVPGSLTVTAAPLTITANDQTKVYGAALPTLTASYTGFVNGDTSASLDTAPTLDTTADATSHVAGSPYAITAGGAVDSDYSISYVPGNLTVTAASLTITANDQTKVYGAALPTLTASYTGFVNGDTSANLDTLPTLDTTADATSHVAGSPYAITASGAVDSDYSISYVPGNLTVTAASLTITANDQTKVYGAALPTLTALYTGFVNGDTSANLDTLPTLDTTADATSHVAGSPYAITASGAVDEDYSISYVPGNLTVTAAPLTITANDQTKVYGAALPTLTASYTGFVNGDTSASLDTAPTLDTTADATSHVAGSPYAITASGAVDEDYSISYVPGSLTVTAAPLTITANDQTKVYGAALPTLTASYTGFVNGDTSANLDTAPMLSTTADATSHVAGSPYVITASGAVDTDYSISYVPGNLTVTAASLTITANDQTKVYGQALPTLTASYTGFVNGDTSANLDTLPTLDTTADATSHVAGSPYAITASGAVDEDYSISYVPGSLTVTAAPLTITANDQTKVYGAALPTLTASYTGFVNGDTSANLDTSPTLSTTADATSHVAGSPYAITASGAVDSDYSISYVPGSLTVTAASLTITANDQTKVYGAALPTLTASYTGFVNGDTAANLDTAPTLDTTADATSHVTGSPYAITASGAVDSDYSISYVPGNLTVTAASLTITANDQTKVYGAALPTLTALYTGFVNGDTSANLDTSPTLSTTADATSHVAGSPYAITASGAVDSDYSISYVPGSLTVTAASLTITANDQTKVYGAALPTLTASYTGFVNGDTSASLDTLPTLDTTADATSHVAGSPYAITASGAVDSDYSISYVPGSLTVTAAPLTITADNQTKVYRAALPTLTASYTGFVNGDTSASLDTLPTLDTTADATSHVAGSPYAITASGAVDTDYSISYVPGNLTVTAAPLTITANDQTKVYGAALPTLTASYTGFVNGDTSANLDTAPMLSTTADATSHVAGSPYAITASGAVDTDYSISYVPGNLTVTAASLTITANDQTKVYGQALPTLTASYTGFVNGDTSANLDTLPTLDTTADAASHVAGSPYAITASGAVDEDYSISYVPGSLTVTAAPLTITANDQTKVYGAALPTLTASYTGFVNGDTSASLDTAPTLDTTADATSHVAGSPYAITAGGAVDSDYSISYVPGNLTVTAASLTITANDQTKVYGAALPTLTASYTGFVNGDTSANLDTLPTLDTTADATSHVAGSPYAITASGAVDSDYSISYVPGNLTVTAASLTITANDQTKVYGAALPTLTALYTGFVNGDTSANLDTAPTLDTTADATSHVAGSPYAITASGAVDSDYTISYVPGSLTVTAAPLTITANDQTKVYGQALPTLTASYTGFVNGDTSASLDTLPTLSTTADAASHVAGSPYAITASGAVDSDYSISYVPGSLTVTAASLTITANDQTKVYGAALPTLTASYTGFVNGDTAANLDTAPTLDTTADATSHVTGSPYAITASGAVDSDYSISYVPGNLTVTAAPLTITANDQTKVYGQALPTLTASYTGFVNGDTSANLDTLPTLSTTADAASHVAGSPYAITASGAVDSDYSISYVPGNLTVTAAPLTITANDQTKVYGQALPTLTASYTGFVNGDTSANLDTLPTLDTTADATSHVAGSPYAITASGAVDEDYTISYVAGSLTVTAAPLTITANDQTKVYGQALPTLTASYTGFVNGDTSANLDTAPTLSTTADATSHVAGSPYAITASGAVDSDYSISYVPGNLTVTAAPLTITANDQTKVYGQALPTLTASYTGFVNGDTSANLDTSPTLSTTADAASHVAGSPYAITASGAVDSDYSISYVPGNLTITAAPLTITADNQTKVYGAALPTLTASYTGFVNGDTAANLDTLPTLSTTADAASHVAGSPYAITASGAVDSDYSISYVPGNLTITAAPLTITADNQTKVYGAALPTLTASYTGFVNGDTSASLDTAPTLDTTADAASHVAGSPYAITASGAVDEDYSISYVPGSLTVTAAPLTITANDQTKVYGAALPTLTASYTGFVNGDTSANLDTLPTLSTAADATSHVAGSPYAITASGAVDTDYSISYVPGNLTVTAAPLTITANDQTKVYGAALPTLTASYTGFVNGDTSASLDTAPTLDTTADATSHVAGSPYAITASGAVDEDYSISYVPGSLTVTAAPLTITANDQTKVYGAALPTLTASYTGFVNGDTSANLDTAPMLSTTADATSHVAGSPYAITASGAVDSDYSISYVPGNLTVTAAPLTITANDQTKVYGQALPTLTASYTGFVNGDTSASLDTAPTLSTTADATSHVAGSPYAITASGAVDSDYSISYVPGSLTVTPTSLTVKVGNQTKIYGQPNPSFIASYQGFVLGQNASVLSGSLRFATSATAGSGVGVYAVAVNGLTSSDYAINFVGGLLSVTPARLTVFAPNAVKLYGLAVPTMSAVYSGFVNGDTAASLTTPALVATTATALSPVGAYPIYAWGASSSNYTIQFVPGVLTVQQNAGPVAFVTTLYKLSLGRLPEPAGLTYWLTQLSNGEPQAAVARLIYASPEAQLARARKKVPQRSLMTVYALALKAEAIARAHA